jgi:predicted nucleic acid-binding protein
VWLDWLVFNDASIKPIQNLVDAGKAEIIIDADCDAELVRVLAYPLQKWTLNAKAQTACVDRFRSVARRIIATLEPGKLPACRDPDDQKFLVLAAAAGAFCLLTKDRALLKLAKSRYALPFHIVTPANFPTLQSVEFKT